MWHQGPSCLVMFSKVQLVPEQLGYLVTQPSSSYSLVSAIPHNCNTNRQFLFVTAFLTSVFILLHTCWGILFFDGIRKRDYFKLGVTLFSHMIASGVVSIISLYNCYIVMHLCFFIF